MTTTTIVASLALVIGTTGACLTAIAHDVAQQYKALHDMEECITRM